MLTHKPSVSLARNLEWSTWMKHQTVRGMPTCGRESMPFHTAQINSNSDVRATRSTSLSAGDEPKRSLDNCYSGTISDT
jgi:hypothetical protein